MPETNSQKTFQDYLFDLASNFIQAYSINNGAFFADNTPRRFHLFSIMNQVLFQKKDLQLAVLKTFLEIDEIRDFFGVTNLEDVLSNENSIYAIQTCVIDNSGSGGSQNPMMAITNIALSAIDSLILEYGSFREELLMTAINKAFDNFKTFIHSEEVNEDHLVGFSGFQTDPDVVMGFGTVNAIAPNDFQSNYFFGGNNSRVGLIIREKYTRKMLFHGPQKEMEKFLQENYDIFNTDSISKMHATVKNIRLSLVLALSKPDNLFYAFVEGDYLICSTGSLGSFIMRDPRMLYKTSSEKLTQHSVNTISIKYLTITDNDLSSINIATNRLLSAVCGRDNPDDALIDAVMCWENIIGAESEVSFRICASIEKLLSATGRSIGESDFKDLKSIYESRSKLVHGNSNYRTDHKTVQLAIMYAIQLINAVLERRDLLTMESKNRSKAILLGHE